MARIILGNGIAQLRGKIGGTSYSAGLSGPVARNKAIINRRSSSRASQAKLFTTRLQSYWSAMSIAERDVWNQFALFKPTEQKHNPGKYLNGQSIFMLYNYAHLVQYNSVLLAPVFSATLPVSTFLSVASVLGVLSVNSTTAIDEATDFAIFKISGRVKPSRSAAPGGVKQIKLTFGNTTAVDITSDYVDRYGIIPASGDYVEIEYQIFSLQATNWTIKGSAVIQVN